MLVLRNYNIKLNIVRLPPKRVAIPSEYEFRLRLGEMMSRPRNRRGKSMKKSQSLGGAKKRRKQAAAHPKGCCTISAPNVADRDIPGVTSTECDAIAAAHSGSVAHWVEGECA
jgi:hypothetical protein